MKDESHIAEGSSPVVEDSTTKKSLVKEKNTKGGSEKEKTAAKNKTTSKESKSTSKDSKLASKNTKPVPTNTQATSKDTKQAKDSKPSKSKSDNPYRKNIERNKLNHHRKERSDKKHGLISIVCDSHFSRNDPFRKLGRNIPRFDQIN